MRYFLLILAGIIITFSSCKCLCKHHKQEAKKVEVSIPVGTTLGKVSYEYKDRGCAVIILVQQEGQTAPMTLIPIEPLPVKFNKDGLEIYFNYHPLKMRQPEGCPKGIPVEVADISIKE